MKFLPAALLIFMVLFSIIAPLTSIYIKSQDLAETVTIVLTSDTFEYEGRGLHGFIIVSLNSPYSINEYTITTMDVERSRVHRFSFERQVEEWDRYFRVNHSKLLKVGVFTIPTNQ